VSVYCIPVIFPPQNNSKTFFGGGEKEKGEEREEAYTSTVNCARYCVLTFAWWKCTREKVSQDERYLE
jgi:hypothetical protein